jgi:hypothetical protein
VGTTDEVTGDSGCSVAHDSIRRGVEPDLSSVSTERVKTLYTSVPNRAAQTLSYSSQTRVIDSNFTLNVVQTFAVYKNLKCCDNARQPQSKSHKQAHITA